MTQDDLSIQIALPVADTPIDLSDRRIRRVWVAGELDDRSARRIGAALATHPDIRFQVSGQAMHDLGFLRSMPTLRHLGLDLGDVPSIEALVTLQALESLSIGATSGPSLGPLEALPRLRTLTLMGRWRDLATVGRLGGLGWLMLSSVPTHDLEPLRGAARLQTLRIRLGGVTDLSALADLTGLRVLSIEQTRALADVAPIAAMAGLESLFLSAEPRVQGLPSFAGAAGLRRVSLETMRGLTDLAPLAAAPGLESLLLIDWRHADPAIVSTFVGHPTLREADLGFGSDRRNTAARAILALPSVRDGTFHLLQPPTP